MSSMRNAVQRRNHKERSQPASRQKWGLLEKKKDYQSRSRSYNLKKAQLSNLRSKASQRNPDEFYFAMTSSSTRDGGIKHIDRPTSVSLTPGAVKLLKTQDAGYLRVQSAVEREKIRRLEEELTFEGCGKHTVFVESLEEKEGFSAEKFFGTPKELVGRRFNRPRVEQIANGEFGDVKVGGGGKGGGSVIGGEEEKAKVLKMASREKTKLVKARTAKYKELEARMKREKQLKEVERSLELQRASMQGGAQVKKNKWARVRKR